MQTTRSTIRMTKIVATLGPASNTKQQIKDLAKAGANVFRLNFSHGSHSEHIATHQIVREVSEELGVHLGIIADLQGPKLRIGKVPGGQRRLESGDVLRFVPNNLIHSEDILLPHPEIFGSVAVGDHVLIDDGRIRLQIKSASMDLIEAKVLNDAVLSDRKGVNFPDTKIELNVITPKDANDLRLALSLGVEWIAMSFVQTAEDVQKLREIINKNAGIIAKIEKPLAVKNIDSILSVADGIMVARGDLGVECAWHELPSIQDYLVSKARAIGKPVIVATQMLESMINSPLPTRAETSDVSNAVVQKADAVMLSAESASGSFPIDAVSAMVAIIMTSEATRYGNDFAADTSLLHSLDDSNAIAGAAGVLAELRQACCITSYTETGATAVRVSKVRGNTPILAVCPNEKTACMLSLVWGVTAIVCTSIEEFNHSRDGNLAPSLAIEGLIKPDLPVVVTSGSRHGVSGGTDCLRIAYLNPSA